MKKITLKNKDYDRFIKALVRPRKPNKALLDAVRNIPVTLEIGTLSCSTPEPLAGN